MKLNVDSDAHWLNQIKHLIHDLERGKQESVAQNQALYNEFLLNILSKHAKTLQVVNKQAHLVAVLAADYLPDGLEDQAHLELVENEALAGAEFIDHSLRRFDTFLDYRIVNLQLHRNMNQFRVDLREGNLAHVHYFFW